jgi:hypothetical protein
MRLQAFFSNHEISTQSSCLAAWHFTLNLKKKFLFLFANYPCGAYHILTYLAIDYFTKMKKNQDGDIVSHK